MEGVMTDYEWPDSWDEMSMKEKQQYFHAHRQRLYAFWRAEAEYQKRRDERVSQFRVDEPLE